MAEAMAVRQPWRREGRWWQAIGLAATLLIAGCQSIVPRGAERGPAVPTQGPPPVAQGPEVVTPFPVDTNRNRVALLVPLTGSNAGVGRSIANATQLALLDTRSEKVRITEYDTAGGAGVAASRAIREGAQLILGPLLSEDVRTVAPIARNAGVPLIAFSNDVSVAGNGTYLMGSAPAQSIGRVVGYARSQGITTFAGLIPNGLYGERASTAFLRSVESAGGQVLGLQTYDRAATELPAAVARLAKNAPYQAVLIPDTGANAAVAAPLLRKSSGDVRIVGTDLWNTEASVKTRPALAGAWFASVSDTLYRQYAVKYRGRFGTAPYRLSSMGYDAVLLTVRISRDWPVGQRFPVERLADAGGFSGIDGAFRFGRDGVAERALAVQEVRGGAIVTVSPAPAGF